jgi:hypothetical protein
MSSGVHIANTQALAGGWFDLCASQAKGINVVNGDGFGVRTIRYVPGSIA